MITETGEFLTLGNQLTETGEHVKLGLTESGRFAFIPAEISGVIPVIVLHEYLDTMLTAQHDLMTTIAGVHEQKIITNVIDPVVGKPGTKGHVR